MICHGLVPRPHGCANYVHVVLLEDLHALLDDAVNPHPSRRYWDGFDVNITRDTTVKKLINILPLLAATR